MGLNRRLKTIIEQVPPCEILADIGTDHAYVPIYAVKTGVCTRALAVDVKTGPLAAASINVNRHGLEKRVEIRHGNGLDAVRISECDVVVIAGMGGLLISEILSLSIEKAKAANVLILQPNNAAEALRKWLYENGFAIAGEKLVKDAGKIYCIIKAKWDGRAESRDEYTYYVGEKVFDGNEHLIEEYLCRKLRIVEVIIGGRRKKRNKKASSCSEFFEHEAIVQGMDTEENKMNCPKYSGGTGRISEMSTETLLDIRNKIRERIITL